MKKISTPQISHFVAIIRSKPFDKSENFVKSIADRLVKDLNLSVVGKFTHKFKPNGLTFGYILSQSHLVIHTWPELGVIHIDLVACKKIEKNEFSKSLTNYLKNKSIISIYIKKIDY